MFINLCYDYYTAAGFDDCQADFIRYTQAPYNIFKKGSKSVIRLNDKMKKKSTVIIICIVAVIVSAGATFLALNVLPNIIAKTSQTQTTTQPTTQTTTRKPHLTTQKQTTAAPTTQAEPVIDLNSLSIIDLYPLSLTGGNCEVKHCQGIAVDKKNEYVYFSYTSQIIKCNFEGDIVGSVTGFGGHLGDITFNEEDGMIYCGHYLPGRTSMGIVIFNASKITKVGMKPSSDIVRTVTLKEPKQYYDASVTFEKKDKKTKEVTKTTYSHRYGVSGIDGVTFGPNFFNKDGKELLTVACGIFSDTQRSDNNYQILLQYDVTDWWNKYAKPYSMTAHSSGPEKANGKCFLYTGNTKYGVQTMEYFDELNLWILNCYAGDKAQFENYNIFAIDADVKPVYQELKGQPKTDKQYVLSLYQDGSHDTKNDIYGWHTRYGVQGIAYMGDGLFYITRPYKTWTGIRAAICYLCVWSPENKNPFKIAADIGNDYSISKKPRIEPKTTAESPKTTKSAEVTNIIDSIREFLF